MKTSRHFIFSILLVLNVEVGMAQLTEQDTIYHYLPEFSIFHDSTKLHHIYTFCFNKDGKQLDDFMPSSHIVDSCVTFALDHHKYFPFQSFYKNFIKEYPDAKIIRHYKLKRRDVWTLVEHDSSGVALNSEIMLLRSDRLIDREDFSLIEDYYTAEMYTEITKYYKLKVVR